MGTREDNSDVVVRHSAYTPPPIAGPNTPCEGALAVPSVQPIDIVTRSCVEPCELMRFFDPTHLAEVYRKSNWTLAQEQAILQEIATNPAELGSTRINAIETMRKHRTEALRMSGKLAEVTSKATKRLETADTTTVLEVARTTSQLLSKYATEQGTVVDAPPLSETTNDRQPLPGDSYGQT